MTQITETGSEGLRRSFRLVLDADDLERRVDARLQEVGAGARLPGFRPGKVPAAILRKRFGESTAHEVRESALQEAVAGLARERGFRLAGPAAVQPAADAGVTAFDVSFEIVPPFELMDLAAIRLTRLKVEVDDAETDAAVVHLVTATGATARAPDSPRPSRHNDVVLVDWSGRAGGQEAGGAGLRVVVGAAGGGNAFAAAMADRRPGDTFTFTGKLPARFPLADARGRDVCIDVTVREVLERYAPAAGEIGDDLARELGFSDLAAMRSFARGNLEEQYARVAQDVLRRQLLDSLAAGHDFDVPPSLVEAEFAGIWRQVKAAMEAGTLDPDDAGKSEDRLASDYRDIAVRRVRLGIVLSTVGHRHGIAVDDDTIARYVQALAEEAARAGESVPRVEVGEPAWERMRMEVYESSIVQLLLGRVSVSEKRATADDLKEAFLATDRYPGPAG